MNVKDKKSAKTIGEMAETALKSTARVVRAFNEAHARETESNPRGARPGVHSEAKAFDRDPQKRS